MEVSWANLRTILLLVSLIVSCGDFVYGAALYEATFALELSFGFTLPFPALNMSSQGSIFPLDSNDIGRILSSSENLELRLESPTTTENRPSKTRISRRSGPGDLRPTPAPTGTPSSAITVHINNEHDFSILLPGRPQGDEMSLRCCRHSRDVCRT